MTGTTLSSSTSIVPRHLARSIGLKRILEHFHWRVRGRGRADCGLCGPRHQRRNSARGTVSFNDSLWKCHRCGAGGDAFNLVMAVHQCGFPAALEYVAGLCGVKLVLPSRLAMQQIDAAQRRRKQQEAEVARLMEVERGLRIECRDKLHELDAQLDGASQLLAAAMIKVASGSFDFLWHLLQELHGKVELQLAEYTLLSFAAVPQRVEYLKSNPEKRQAMIAAIYGDGFVRAGDGKLISTLAPGTVIHAGEIGR
jgi:hypothetical protein